MIAFIFILLFIPLLIILGLAYFRTKKIYSLMYILSAFSYIITIAYFICAWKLQKNSIIAIMGISAILLMAIGFHISGSKKRKFHNSGHKKTYGIIIPFAIIIFAAIIGVANIGMRTQIETVSSVDYSQVFGNKEMEYSNRENHVLLQTITIKNNFLLSNFEKIPKYKVCFYPINKSYDLHHHLTYYLDNKSFYRDVVEIPGKTKKTIEIRLYKSQREIILQKPNQTSDAQELKKYNYNEILLIDRNKQEQDFELGGFVDCNSLSKEQIDGAIKIKIIR